MFTGTALSVRLLVYVGLSLFIIGGPYLYMVVSVLYAYNLTQQGMTGNDWTWQGMTGHDRDGRVWLEMTGDDRRWQ